MLTKSINSVRGEDQQALQRVQHLKWITLIRVLFNTLILIATIMINLHDLTRGGEHIYQYLYYLALVMYAACFIYTGALRSLRSARAIGILTYIQFGVDIIYASGLVFVTGGTESVFTFTFLLVIFASAIVLYRVGALFIACIAVAVIALMGLMEMDVLSYGEYFRAFRTAFIPGQLHPQFDEVDLFYRVAINVTLNSMAFIGVALLSSWLSEELRSSRLTLRRHRHSFEDLKALHQNIINSLLTGLITVDQHRRVTFFNQVAEQTTGYSQDQVLGKDVIHIFRDLKHILANPHKGQAMQYEETIQLIGKRHVYLRWSISLLKDFSDTVIGHTLMFQDVTHIKAMERNVQRTEKMAAIGELAAAIAHEIRNPLAAISGAVQLLSKTTQFEGDDFRLMSIVLRETETLNRWLTDFLSYSRPTPMDQRQLDMNRLVEDSIIMFRQDRTLKNITIEKELGDSLYVVGDEARLKQVVWNLLTNAAQSMPDGGTVCVTLNGGEVLDSSSLELSVTDEGEGIPTDRLDKVFQPFFTTKDNGTGLGLAIVHRILEDHQAGITVESDVGEGTTFRVTFEQTASGGMNG